MFDKILVVTCGADPEQVAVQRALLYAGPQTALTVLDVVHEPMLDGYAGNTAIYEPLRARVVAERRGRMEALAAVLNSRGFVVTSETVWDHPLEEAVARQVRSRKADLVVMAPPGPGLSHTDWRLVATCPASVLVAKGPLRQAYRTVVAAVDPFHAHAKPADLDVTILAHARALQMQLGAKLEVVHCHEPIEYLGGDIALPSEARPDARRRALEQMLERAGVPAEAASLPSGAPHEVLHKMVERGEADVIVMGVIARGRIKDWLLGSTAERVLHDTNVDVLAVKPAQPH
jgi:universal stress protein E